jgi:hypothetical protein
VRRQILLPFVLLLLAQVAAMSRAAHAANQTAPAIVAVQVEKPPVLDGTLNDPAWKNAAHVQLMWDFTFRRPANETTDAYLLADSHYLYVAFVAKQHEPLVASQHTNDQPLTTDDFVRIFLFPDGQSGFEYSFAINPIGTRYATSSENAAYAPTWSAAATRNGGGYVVTARIPLRAMRSDGHTTWRVQFDRRMFALNDYVEWAHSDAQTNTDDILYTNQLTGMNVANAGTRTKPRVNLYGLGEVAAPSAGGSTSRVGADVALPITPTASFLATFHPDYSNVELDQQTISPTAFPRRYNEVRPFFTQGANFYNQFDCNDCIGYPLLYTPNIPTPRDGYAVEGVQGPVNFAAFDSLSDGRTDAAQALRYVTDDRHFFALFQRSAVDMPGVHDDVSYLQAIVSNTHNFSAYVTEGDESGTLVSDAPEGQYREYGLNLYTPKEAIYAAYHDIGSQYAPLDGFNQINDVKGPTIYSYKEFDYGPHSYIQSVTVSDDVAWMHNHLAQLDDAYNAVSLTVNTRTLFTLQATAGNQYLLFPGRPGGVANQNGVTLSYNANGSTPTSVSYNIGRFGTGYLLATTRSTTLPIGRRGTLTLEADDTNDSMDSGDRFVQWLERVSVGYQLDGSSSVALGVRRIIGTGPPFFTVPVFTDASNVSFAYHRRIAKGELYVVYGDPNALSTTPALIGKYIFYVGAEKGT